MKELGVIKKDEALSPEDSQPWAAETDKKAMARRMETYAAMVDVMDRGIGKIIAELKQQGLFENTIIFYLQDNGGCHESIGWGDTRPVAEDTTKVQRLTKETILYTNKPPITRDGKMVMQGKAVMAGPADTYVSYMQDWANVSNTPFRLYKHWVHEGGISTPLIVHWPAGIKEQNGFRSQVGHEIDMMPTILQLAGATYPSTFKNHKITPVEGISLVPTFSNKPIARTALYWEHEVNRAVRMGNWKLVAKADMLDGGYGTWKSYKTEPWELYDISKDRSELHNLSKQYPALVTKMTTMWQAWANRCKVYPQPWQEKEE